MPGAWERYQAQLRTAPLRTKAATAAVVAGLSDLIAQTLAAQSTTGAPTPAQLQLRRSLKFALFGALWSGPSVHFWQQTVEGLFAGAAPGAGTAARKVLLDQLTYGPVSNVLMMSYVALVVEGRTAASLVEGLKRSFVRVQLRGWRFWPVVSALQYRFVPVPLRALVANLAGLLWSTYIVLSSAAARRALPLPPPPPPPRKEGDGEGETAAAAPGAAA